MGKEKTIITGVLVVLLAVFLQVLFVFADIQDTPNKAATEFAKAYFRYNEAIMSDRLCEERRIVDDVNVVKKYVNQKTSGSRKFRGSHYNLQ